MTQEELDQILAAHKLWLESGRKRGKRAHLLKADLRGANLEGANLQEVNLRYANLQGADLRGANLFEADLYSADLRAANLQEADLRWARLAWTNLRGAIVPLSIRNCDSFYGAKVSADALPWLILHPEWPKYQKPVRIAEGTE